MLLRLFILIAAISASVQLTQTPGIPAETPTPTPAPALNPFLNAQMAYAVPATSKDCIQPSPPPPEPSCDTIKIVEHVTHTRTITDPPSIREISHTRLIPVIVPHVSISTKLSKLTRVETRTVN
jgi:hypothetical protein